MKENIQIIGLGTVGILLVDILLVLFDALPDWWYIGWIWQPWSVATGKIIILASATVFIVIIAGVLIREKRKEV